MSKLHPKHDHIMRVLRAGHDIQQVQSKVSAEAYDAAWAGLRRYDATLAETLIESGARDKEQDDSRSDTVLP
jgi:hypothetical protein